MTINFTEIVVDYAWCFSEIQGIAGHMQHNHISQHFAVQRRPFLKGIFFKRQLSTNFNCFSITGFRKSKQVKNKLPKRYISAAH